MTNYLHLTAPIRAPHYVGATRRVGDDVWLKIDDVLGSDVLACGSAIDLRDYEGRWEIVTRLPRKTAAEDLGDQYRAVRLLDYTGPEFW